MKDRTVFSLVGLALILLVISYMLYGHLKSQRDAFVPGGELLPGFDIDQVHKIMVRDSDGIVVLAKEKDNFVLEEKSRYPASNSRINDFFKQCSSITLAEEVTDDPKKHAVLGVASVESEDGEDSILVTFFDKADKKLAEFIVGKMKENGPGRYVRISDKPAVYISEAALRFQSDYKSYIDRQLLDIERHDIERVRVNPEGRSYIITADEDGQPMLEDIPAGKKVKGTEYKQVFTALSPLQITDFALASDSGIRDLQFEETYRASLRDKRVYTLRIARDADKYYIKISAEAEVPTRVTISRDESEEELKKKDEMLQLAKSVQDFNNFNANWVYSVDSHTGEKLTKAFNKLIE